MKYQNILKSSLSSKRNSNMATFAIIGGIAVGIAVGVLFATKKGKDTKSRIIDIFAKITGKSSNNKASVKLGNLIENVRGQIKQNAEGLLGNENSRTNASEIHVAHTGTTAWKNQNEKTNFPNEPHLKN